MRKYIEQAYYHATYIYFISCICEYNVKKQACIQYFDYNNLYRKTIEFSFESTFVRHCSPLTKQINPRKRDWKVVVFFQSRYFERVKETVFTKARKTK